jgi:hypothetical protein
MAGSETVAVLAFKRVSHLPRAPETSPSEKKQVSPRILYRPYPAYSLCLK